MKNQVRITLAVFLLTGGMLLMNSCNKVGFERSGQLIRFGTVSEGPLTKTEYAGKDYDNNKIEPIWWKTGDEICIVSDLATITDKPSTVPANHMAKYKIKAFVTENNVTNKSKATLQNSGNNGLAWGDKADEEYNFYAVYPSTVNIGYEGAKLGLIDEATVFHTQTLVAHEYVASETGTAKDWYTVTGGKYTVYEPEMTNAIMTAAASCTPAEINFDSNRYVYKNGEDNGLEVPLNFYPAFTAFEFTFESADPSVDINLTEFRMESTSTALTGKFSGMAGSRSFSPVATTDDDEIAASKKVSVLNPNVLGTIKNGAPKSFTVFALAQDLTDLTIYFSDKDSDNQTRTRKLALNDKDTGQPITFDAGQKYRIKGLKLPGNRYQFFLTLNGVVQEWEAVELKTSFSEQIQCSALTFDKSAREMTQEYQDANGGRTNHYQSPAPVGDGRWQVRTLNNASMDDLNYDYFTVTFKPSAPLGGYWRLDTHGNPYFKVQVVTEESSQFEPTLSDLPDYGRIMNQTVKLRITPIWSAINGPDVTDDTEIGLYMDCYFYTNIDSEPLDANTEFQDVHGNGKYSYWLITVAR